MKPFRIAIFSVLWLAAAVAFASAAGSLALSLDVANRDELRQARKNTPIRLQGNCENLPERTRMYGKFFCLYRRLHEKEEWQAQELQAFEFVAETNEFSQGVSITRFADTAPAPNRYRVDLGVSRRQLPANAAALRDVAGALLSSTEVWVGDRAQAQDWLQAEFRTALARIEEHERQLKIAHCLATNDLGALNDPALRLTSKVDDFGTWLIGSASRVSAETMDSFENGIMKEMFWYHGSYYDHYESGLLKRDPPVGAGMSYNPAAPPTQAPLHTPEGGEDAPVKGLRPRTAPLRAYLAEAAMYSFCDLLLQDFNDRCAAMQSGPVATWTRVAPGMKDAKQRARGFWTEFQQLASPENSAALEKAMAAFNGKCLHTESLRAFCHWFADAKEGGAIHIAAALDQYDQLCDAWDLAAAEQDPATSLETAATLEAAIRAALETALATLRATAAPKE